MVCLGREHGAVCGPCNRLGTRACASSCGLFLVLLLVTRASRPPGFTSPGRLHVTPASRHPGFTSPGLHVSRASFHSGFMSPGLHVTRASSLPSHPKCFADGSEWQITPFVGVAMRSAAPPQRHPVCAHQRVSSPDPYCVLS